MRFGVVIYFIPLFFVLEPALVLQSSWQEALYYISLCIGGTVVLAGGLVGYFWKLGKIDECWKRWLLGLSGVAIAAPHTLSSIIGGVVAILVMVLHGFVRKTDEADQEISKLAAGTTGKIQRG
jgi:TRAP-type uncharacterized transport system fused permease subunit